MTEIQLLTSIREIDSQTWDSLWRSRYPFLRHAFLSALENSRSTCEETGWQPRHLLVRDAGRTVAAMPLYIKHHSYGEYVFDWGWAEAYHRHGIPYYPKLLSAIPFTPATGPRLAVADDIDRDTISTDIHQYLAGFCQREQFSGWHSLFHSEAENRAWVPPMLSRCGCQFHWFNRDYSDFDDFLATFNSRKRKSVRRERRQVGECGVELQRLTGSAIGEPEWELFYHFYHTTYLKRSGATGYLTREFFQELAAAMADQVLMVVARREGKTIAAALCLFDDTHLFGRYWGCSEEVPGLHFEACYYQGIEFAIEHGLKVFDPGAQGEHKIQRGFEPVTTWSSHWLGDPRFSAAVEDFLSRERLSSEAYRRDCANYLPFRRCNDGN